MGKQSLRLRNKMESNQIKKHIRLKLLQFFLCIFSFVLFPTLSITLLDWNTALQMLSKEFFLLHISDLKFTTTTINHLRNQTNSISVVLCKRISNTQIFSPSCKYPLRVVTAITS
jgi:hypothetical protein